MTIKEWFRLHTNITMVLYVFFTLTIYAAFLEALDNQRWAYAGAFIVVFMLVGSGAINWWRDRQ